MNPLKKLWQAYLRFIEKHGLDQCHCRCLPKIEEHKENPEQTTKNPNNETK